MTHTAPRAAPLPFSVKIVGMATVFPFRRRRRDEMTGWQADGQRRVSISFSLFSVLQAGNESGTSADLGISDSYSPDIYMGG